MKTLNRTTIGHTLITHRGYLMAKEEIPTSLTCAEGTKFDQQCNIIYNVTMRSVEYVRINHKPADKLLVYYYTSIVYTIYIMNIKLVECYTLGFEIKDEKHLERTSTAKHTTL